MMINTDKHTFDFIDKLLEGAEVEWKTIDEIFHVKNGYTPSKKNKEFWTNGTVPWFRMEDIRTNGRILSDSIQHVSESAVKGGKYFPANSIIIATSATIGEHALITVPYLSNQRFTNLSLKNEYKKVLMPKFIYHFCFTIDEWCKNNTTVGNFAGVDMNGFKKFQIPIPPLKVQEEIVRILDTFTELTAKLTAELTARKKQYSYYRDELLSFNGQNQDSQDALDLQDKVVWKTLGEVGEVRMCKRILKNQTSERGDIPFYKIGTFGKKPNAFISKELFYEYKSKYNYPKIGEVLISASGTIGRAVVFDGQDAYFQDSNIVWIENDESQVLNKFLFHFYKVAKWHTAEGGTIKRLYNNDLKKTKIPIPPLAEQERIVSILDKFDTLTNSISKGLPKEIELRKKQYEYYRDKLLTF
ncbi:restriction endonuclease subunit S [Geofilum sp. OHC36d9]|uniref:restriction endonuclease subunit S n=1 Tax=Geofilum sp. OHC36d9 TaxID=3458413 RepID=UPI0040348B9F